MDNTANVGVFQELHNDGCYNLQRTLVSFRSCITVDNTAHVGVFAGVVGLLWSIVQRTLVVFRSCLTVYSTILYSTVFHSGAV